MKTESQSKAYILLEDGLLMEGTAIGMKGTSGGEICFNTGMTGYQEIITDPSYKGQMVAMTYSQIGNYGINKEDIEPTIKRVQTTDDFEAAVSNADFVEEAIGENLELKQDFFQRLDSLCSEDAILATNTSVIRVTEIADKSKRIRPL